MKIISTILLAAFVVCGVYAAVDLASSKNTHQTINQEQYANSTTSISQDGSNNNVDIQHNKESQKNNGNTSNISTPVQNPKTQVNITFKSDIDVRDFIQFKKFYAANGNTINTYDYPHLMINDAPSPFTVKKLEVVDEHLGLVTCVGSMGSGNFHIYVYPDRKCISSNGVEYYLK